MGFSRQEYWSGVWATREALKLPAIDSDLLPPGYNLGKNWWQMYSVIAQGLNLLFHLGLEKVRKGRCLEFDKKLSYLAYWLIANWLRANFIAQVCIAVDLSHGKKRGACFHCKGNRRTKSATDKDAQGNLIFKAICSVPCTQWLRRNLMIRTNRSHVNSTTIDSGLPIWTSPRCWAKEASWYWEAFNWGAENS